MKNSSNSFSAANFILPQEIKTAIDAIDLPEVQNLIEQLSKYNLAVCVPHKHNDLTGDFELLPLNEIQVESNLKVNFMDSKNAYQIEALPVAWRWINNGVNSMAACIAICTPTNSQTNGEGHKRSHDRL